MNWLIVSSCVIINAITLVLLILMLFTTFRLYSIQNSLNTSEIPSLLKHYCAYLRNVDNFDDYWNNNFANLVCFNRYF